MLTTRRRSIFDWNRAWRPAFSHSKICIESTIYTGDIKPANCAIGRKGKRRRTNCIYPRDDIESVDVHVMIRLTIGTLPWKGTNDDRQVAGNEMWISINCLTAVHDNIVTLCCVNELGYYDEPRLFIHRSTIATSFRHDTQHRVTLWLGNDERCWTTATTTPIIANLIDRVCDV